MLTELEGYIANRTSMEPEYHFHSGSVTVPPQSSIHITVTVVSKCSQQGLSGPFAVDFNPKVNDRAVFTSVHDVVSKTESGPKEYKHDIIMMNGKFK